MDIIRASKNDTDLFDASRLSHAACCFYTEDRTGRFFFEIVNHTEAIVHHENDTYINEAIDEFLFYSGFISKIRNNSGEIIRYIPEKCFQKIPITDIQPSQFYINERKLNECKLWIKSEADIRIPVTRSSGELISLDGHTRMKAARDMGFDYALVFEEDTSEYIFDFAAMAKEKDIMNVDDMPVVSDEEYTIKWHNFCDNYFNRI